LNVKAQLPTKSGAEIERIGADTYLTIVGQALQKHKRRGAQLKQSPLSVHVKGENLGAPFSRSENEPERNLRRREGRSKKNLV